ncbi:hypothetical protein LP420_17260 [Massilia sp. B-10]|nr:hypothetical protein LP420_17260 [Massilia sp. B-10]UUZ56596.1 hypothetical protein LP419_16715 [Massilia sp. H-1]
MTKFSPPDHGCLVELNNEQCQEISGGMAFVPAAAIAVAALSLFSAAEKVGDSMGRVLQSHSLT